MASKAQSAPGAEHRSDLPGWERAHDLADVISAVPGFVAEHPAQIVHFLARPFGQGGDGAFFDWAVFTPAFPQPESGGRVPVGDGIDGQDNEKNGE